jgi:hypothetical protein
MATRGSVISAVLAHLPFVLACSGSSTTDAAGSGGTAHSSGLGDESRHSNAGGSFNAVGQSGSSALATGGAQATAGAGGPGGPGAGSVQAGAGGLGGNAAGGAQAGAGGLGGDAAGSAQAGAGGLGGDAAGSAQAGVGGLGGNGGGAGGPCVETFDAQRTSCPATWEAAQEWVASCVTFKYAWSRMTFTCDGLLEVYYSWIMHGGWCFYDATTLEVVGSSLFLDIPTFCSGTSYAVSAGRTTSENCQVLQSYPSCPSS